MPEDRTVLDHLLEGRDALQREVARLTAAIEQLDSVLGRIGTMGRNDAPVEASDDPAEPVPTDVTPVAAPVTVSTPPEPVNPPAEVEPQGPVTVPARPRAVRKAPAKKGTRSRRTTTTSAEPPKSIRVHVLEMLQAENREFGLAEIIDRVHDAGIQAHDDAVRSITIKLMKDGRVERVGRGQYRLARRSSAARASAAVATAPRVTEPAHEPVADTAPATDAAQQDDVSEPAQPGPVDPGYAAPVAESVPDDEAVEDTTDDTTDDTAQDPALDGANDAERGSYAPSLNLGQPWNS